MSNVISINPMSTPEPMPPDAGLLDVTGTFPPSMSFADLVDRFCQDMADFRSRLAQVVVGGDCGPRDAPIRDRGAPQAGP